MRPLGNRKTLHNKTDLVGVYSYGQFIELAGVYLEDQSVKPIVIPTDLGIVKSSNHQIINPQVSRVHTT